MKFVYDKCNYQSDKLHFKNVKALEKLDKIFVENPTKNHVKLWSCRRAKNDTLDVFLYEKRFGNQHSSIIATNQVSQHSQDTKSGIKAYTSDLQNQKIQKYTKEVAIVTEI